MNKIPTKITHYKFYNTYFLFFCGYLLSKESFIYYPMIILGYILLYNNVILQIILLILGPVMPPHVLWFITGGFFRINLCIFDEEMAIDHKNFLLGIILGNIVYPKKVYMGVTSLIGILIIFLNFDLNFLCIKKLNKTHKLKTFYRKLQSRESINDEKDFKFYSKLIVDKILEKGYFSTSYISISMVLAFLNINQFTKVLVLLVNVLPIPKSRTLTLVFILCMLFGFYLIFWFPFVNLNFLLMSILYFAHFLIMQYI